MNARVTQADVARKAGVHVTTVSLALRNHPSLPVTTRSFLQALAQEMGYRPDPDLRALMAYRRGARTKKSASTLAYVTNAGSRWGWKDAPAHQDFFDGAHARAEQLGYTLEHFWLGEPGMTQQRLSNILVSRGLTGVILASQWSEGSDSVQFEWDKFVGVRIDFCPRTPLLHSVTNDQRGIMQLAMRHVIDAGYRRIGMVMPYWWDECVDLAWSAGFLAIQARLSRDDQIPILFYPEQPGGEQPASIGLPAATPAQQLESWLKTWRPEVVLSYAPFVLPTLRSMNLQVPRDVAFVDIFLHDPDGSMAGVHHNCSRVGQLAVEIVDAQLQHNAFGVPSLQTVTLVEGTWHDGPSLPPRN